MYLPTPPPRQGVTQRQFFMWSLTDLNSQFYFSKTRRLTKAKEPILPNKAKEPSLPNNLLIAGANNWIHTFPKY